MSMDQHGYEIIPDTPEVPVAILIQYIDGVAHYYYSVSLFPEVWIPYVTPPLPNVTAPTQAGIVFDPAGVPGSVEAVSFRVLSGALVTDTPPPPHSFEETEDLQAIDVPPIVPPDPVDQSEEAMIHGLVAAQFGDLEYDVGKSVGWMEHFSDDLFVSDINMGEQRYWVVNWTKSFYGVEYIFTSLNFFTDAANFRKQQFLDAEKRSRDRPDLLNYDDSDWVIFIDAHEGLSADNRSLPDDYNIEPFKSFIFREIARANEDELDRVVLPFFVFLRHDHVQNVEYDIPTMSPDGTPGPPIVAQQPCGVPYYLPYQGLTRMFRVDALRDPEFDWSLLDTPVAVPDANVKLQIISYGYAHWNNQDIEPPQTEVPPLSASNDEGWKQRCLLSQVTPITGLPVGDPDDPIGTWVAPDDPETPDPAGVRGPWAADTYESQLINVVLVDPPPDVAAATAGVLVPLYDLTFRLNLRDGVWYEGDALGNIPLRWDDTEQKWMPMVPPEQWTTDLQGATP